MSSYTTQAKEEMEENITSCLNRIDTLEGKLVAANEQVTTQAVCIQELEETLTTAEQKLLNALMIDPQPRITELEENLTATEQQLIDALRVNPQPRIVELEKRLNVEKTQYSALANEYSTLVRAHEVQHEVQRDRIVELEQKLVDTQRAWDNNAAKFRIERVRLLEQKLDAVEKARCAYQTRVQELEEELDAEKNKSSAQQARIPELEQRFADIVEIVKSFGPFTRWDDRALEMEQRFANIVEIVKSYEVFTSRDAPQERTVEPEQEGEVGPEPASPALKDAQARVVVLEAARDTYRAHIRELEEEHEAYSVVAYFNQRKADTRISELATMVVAKHDAPHQASIAKLQVANEMRIHEMETACRARIAELETAHQERIAELEQQLEARKTKTADRAALWARRIGGLEEDCEAAMKELVQKGEECARLQTRLVDSKSESRLRKKELNDVETREAERLKWHGRSFGKDRMIIEMEKLAWGASEALKQEYVDAGNK